MSAWWTSLRDAVVERLRQLDEAAAHEAAARFEAARMRRRPGSSRVVRLDAAGIARLLTPVGRPLVVHHIAWGAMDGLEHLSPLAERAGDRAGVVVVAWRGSGPVTQVEEALATTLAADPGTWRVLVHPGEDAALSSAIGLESPPPARTVLLDARGDAERGVLRQWTGAPNPQRTRAIVRLLDEVVR